jgi:hypothetical protein
VYERRIKVDKAKLEATKHLSPPTNIKGVCSFIRRAGFYKRFIKDFSQIAHLFNKPAC